MGFDGIKGQKQKNRLSAVYDITAYCFIILLLSVVPGAGLEPAQP